jgi:pimeloyl-ACP methyl ester carboxylesterase
MAGELIETHGIQLYFETHGDGDPLLFLHGFLGSGDNWQYIFKSVPEGYRLIAPDLRGHGASTNPSNVFTFRQASDDIFALLDHLGIERVKAIGVSGGGITLLHMATAQPARLESMVVVSAPPYFPAQARAVQAQFNETMLPENERAALRRRHKYGEAQIEALFDQGHAFATSYDDVNFTPPLLSTITAPTLIVFGDREGFYPVSLGFELHDAIPRSHLWIVPNGGHGPVFGANGPRFTETAFAFLRGDWAER